MSIDWFIPFHGKDKDTLQLSIDSIIKNFSNVGRLFIVTNEDFCINRPNVIIVKEPSEIDDVSRSEIALKFKAVTGKSDRAGWVWQQLLKLNADSIISDISDVFIWQDSDVLWCRNQGWHLADADAIIGKVDEYHTPYANAFARITGVQPALGFSTIRHHEYVRKGVLTEIRKTLSAIHGVSFTRSVVDNLDYSQSSNLSEYDLYANWCAMSGKRTFIHELVWQNTNHIPAILPKDYDFLSPQLWMRNT
jgi:hypothetical protein